ncbi:MAG TPA: hypothetical protein VIK78_20530 [Ruminiclostridium sp.]
MARAKLVSVDFIPKCPYCEKELEQIGSLSTGILSVTKIIVCPYCRKILGSVYRA